MKSDWGNDSVSVQDCSDHTASALCPGLIFGFPGPAQHLMRFHTSASGVSFLLYTLCYESIQKPWSDDSLCCWRNNHSLCSPSSAWLLWPQCIPLMTPHPALTCSHPKLFQHPWIFDSFCATSQIRYGELLLGWYKVGENLRHVQCGSIAIISPIHKLVEGGVCVHTQSHSCCNPLDCSPPDSSVRGIFQARTLEWLAMSSSRGSSQPKDQTCISCIGRQILYCWVTGEAQKGVILL